MKVKTVIALGGRVSIEEVDYWQEQERKARTVKNRQSRAYASRWDWLRGGHSRTNWSHVQLEPQADKYLPEEQAVWAVSCDNAMHELDKNAAREEIRVAFETMRIKHGFYIQWVGRYEENPYFWNEEQMNRTEQEYLTVYGEYAALIDTYKRRFKENP